MKLPTGICRNLSKSKENDPAPDLVWKVFREFDAPDYSEEGTKEFRLSLRGENRLSQLCLYGAFVGEELIGVAATRNGGTHPALFFVEGAYHRQGGGRMLFQAAREAYPLETTTVHSSPYALPVYRRFGFRETAAEEMENGVRYTPMELRLS